MVAGQGKEQGKMKICPICDSKVDGIWCRQCHHFIKPVDINTTMHLNESHDPAHDADCEYHNDTSRMVNRSNMNREVYDKIFGEGAYDHKNVYGEEERKSAARSNSSTQSRTYTSSSTRKTTGNSASTGSYTSQGSYTSTGSSTKSTGSYATPKVRRKKSGCGCGTLFIIWILIAIVTQIVIPIAGEINEYGWDEFIQEIQYMFSFNDGSADNWQDIILADNTEWNNAIEIQEEETEPIGSEAFLALENKPEPIDVEKDDTRTYYKYDENDIILAGIGCDKAHADMSVDDYMQSLLDIFGVSELERYKEDESNNQIAVYEKYDSSYAAFDTTYGFEEGNIKIEVSFDTATRRIHEINIVMYEKGYTEETAELIRQCIEAAAPDYPYSPDGFAEAYKAIIAQNTMESDKQQTLEYTVYMYASDLSMSVYMYAQHE